MSLFRRAALVLRNLVIAPARSKWNLFVEHGAIAVAERIYALAGRAARFPFRREQIELPPALSINGSQIDVVDDLSAFTGLPRPTVESELATRSFRAEWHATAPQLREDHWYYLSSKGYLFANAIHFPDESFVTRYVQPHVASPARVLDFGAGTGNLSLGLVAAGYRVTAIELSALQRDFIRFRVRRHALDDSLDVIDWWARASGGAYDAIVAVDVLEHLPDGARVLDEQLLPALKPGGVLVENSPFVRNAANPMHHDDFGLTEHLSAAGFTVADTGDDGTRVWVAHSQ